jgi:type I restriction enzyme S subunit
MSELPPSWSWTTIDEIASTSSGGTPSRTRSDFYGGSIPWVKSGELNDGFVTEIEEAITEEGLRNSSAKIFQSGTLCIALYGATVGKVGILARNAATNQAVCGINPHTQIDAKYLFYFFQSQRSTLIGLSQGGAQPNISQQIVRSTAVPLCAHGEQDRIVAEIEKQLTRLDAATAALKRVQANLKLYRASVLKAACEGRLVPTEAELARQEGRNYEPAEKLLQRILRERRARWEADTLAKMQASGKPPKDDHWKQKYKEPSAPDTTNLSALPEGWCWASLEQLIVSGPQNGLYKANSSYGSGNPIIRIDDYQNDWYRPATDLRVLQLEAEEFNLYGLESRDILINRVNSPSHLGKCICIPDEWVGAVFESNMMRLQVAELLSAQSLMNYLHSDEGRERLTSNAKWAVNQASINQEDVKATPVPLPPQREQTRIAQSVSLALSQASRTSEAIEAQIHRSACLRQATLCAAFTGQLVPQDPTDEPASSLLERIRAERVESSKKSIQRKAVRKRGKR